MAKLVRRITSNDKIVGSNPARGIFFGFSHNDTAEISLYHSLSQQNSILFLTGEILFIDLF
jgi:hypothetical protein